MRGQLISARPPMGARGGIGRRARFRSVFRKEWWFDSTRAHHLRDIRKSSPGRFAAAEPSGCGPLAGFVKIPRRGRIEPHGEKGGVMADWATMRLTWEPRMLSILRIMTGLLFLQHGLQKIFAFPPPTTPRAFELFTLVPGLAGVLELVGGILIILGLFTRPVAFILAGEMAFAYFMSHAPRGFFPIGNGGNAGELAILYCFVFLYLWLAGRGAWSLDRLWARGTSSTLLAAMGRA